MRNVIFSLICVDDWLSNFWTVGAHSHREVYGRTLSVAEPGPTDKIRMYNKKPLEAQSQTEALGLDVMLMSAMSGQHSEDSE